jgi:hypothetical protein
MTLRASISTRLRYQHEALPDLVEGLTDEQLRRQVISGKWSIFENLAHLQTYQHTFLDRVHQIIRQDNPSFGRYTAEADPLFLDTCEKPTREITRDLLELRKEIAAEISNYPKQLLERTGNHPLYGSLPLTGWLHFFLLHEAHHLFTIFKLAAALRKES